MDQKKLIQKNQAAYPVEISFWSTLKRIHLITFYQDRGRASIGQLTDRFQIEKIRARKLWYLTNRIARKVLAHTVCACINKKIGNPPLQFELLVKP